MKTLTFVLGGALALNVLSFDALAAATPDAPHIYVKGEATLTTMPDYVQLSVGITEVDKDLIAAKNKTDLTIAKAIKLVKEIGVKEGDINAGQISINRDSQYNRTTGNQEFKGFKVSRTLTVKLSDINKYPELLQSLVNNGINEINQTQFLASNYNELHKKAQKLAIKDAQDAAKEFSEDYGVDLKGLYSASLSPLNVQSQPYMRAEKVMMADSPPSNYVPDAYHAGEIKVTASSYAVYYID
ncbi:MULTISPECIES: SIMPL domain-containing protein [Pseudoalteromonas]|uniref:SIMPL domain-containing protein n=1 Tax=Pseudoalteromonas TaxID=53246 RepID=UPI000C33C2DB|nr:MULTISPECIES: SIMPL domain-containing protein [Pseudoalteromonas]PKG68265.1 SIMPL domain-containing protein [Pseudoalteromonas arctica]PKG71197.1 SIMPL domain-containing protein [Pseudoalteromonas sp. GutCa3]